MISPGCAGRPHELLGRAKEGAIPAPNAGHRHLAALDLTRRTFDGQASPRCENDASANTGVRHRDERQVTVIKSPNLWAFSKARPDDQCSSIALPWARFVVCRPTHNLSAEVRATRAGPRRSAGQRGSPRCRSPRRAPNGQKSTRHQRRSPRDARRAHRGWNHRRAAPRAREHSKQPR